MRKKNYTQIQLEEAIALYLRGGTMKVLIPGDDWEDYRPATLEEALDGVLFFAEAAKPEPTAEGSETEADSTPAPEPDAKEETGKTGDISRHTDKKKIDDGKIKALKDAGWSNAKIADEMGVSITTVANHLKKIAGQG